MARPQRALACTRGPDFSPAPIVECLEVPGGRVRVIRDDQLAGGTKQRAAVPFLADCRAQGFEEFVYASPFSGFAQVALAVSCEALGLKCTLYCESDPGESFCEGEVGRASGRQNAHEFTRLAETHGAEIRLAPSLSEAEELAETHAMRSGRCFKVPLGFNTPAYKGHLESELRRQWEILSRELPVSPRVLWLPLGSGTLASVFRAIVPRETTLRCVDVHVLDGQDSRIQRLRGSEHVEVLSAPERFHLPAQVRPPIASNRFYDAKLWRFIAEHGDDGDVWWNVAR